MFYIPKDSGLAIVFLLKNKVEKGQAGYISSWVLIATKFYLMFSSQVAIFGRHQLSFSISKYPTFRRHVPYFYLSTFQPSLELLQLHVPVGFVPKMSGLGVSVNVQHIVSCKTAGTQYFLETKESLQCCKRL